MREIINGIFYVMRSGCPRRLLPSDLPPWGTIYRRFARSIDLPPLKWPDLKYGFDQGGSDRWQGRGIQQKRL
ncbi:MAG: transposase [Stellaceae bacterium]